MKMTLLGTGNANVTECYNTCFVLEDETAEEGERYFLVDGGGGNGILAQLERAGIDRSRIHTMFISHRHTDHIMGGVWIMRNILHGLKYGDYEGEATIYGNEEVIHILYGMAQLLFTEKDLAFIGPNLHLVTVKDTDEYWILGRKVTFFDTGSTKVKMTGFCMDLEPQTAESAAGECSKTQTLNRMNTIYAVSEKNRRNMMYKTGVLGEFSDSLAGNVYAPGSGEGKVCAPGGAAGPDVIDAYASKEAAESGGAARRVLTFYGDEPCYEYGRRYARNAEWVLFESFCLYEDADRFRPYEKGHSTVKDACMLAQELGVRNLVLYHTEDTDLAHRKERYFDEGRRYYHGNLSVPDDLDVIELTER